MTLQRLRAKQAKAPSHHRLATLCFVGMSLSASVRYNPHADKVVGYDARTVNNGEQLEPKTVNEAVVATLRGVSDNWKQPIAYYPVHRTLGQSGFKSAIDECLIACHGAGIQDVALVVDQESTQMTLLSKLTSHSTPYMQHPVTKEPVFVIIDIPHCLKNARNAFMKNDIEFDGCKVARWQHLTVFYTRDCPSSLRLVCRLSDAHFNLTLGQTMRVSLAAQVFSHSVACGIKTMVHHGELEQEALQTSEFLKRINDAFDLLNSANLSGEGCKQPIRRDLMKKHMAELLETEAFIQSWRFRPRSGKAVKGTMGFK